MPKLKQPGQQENKMALLNRLIRLFRADFHAVIDELEEPYLLLKQSVREMETVLQLDQQQLEGLQQQQTKLNDRIKSLDDDISSHDDNLTVCFNAKNDDLARSLIKRKLECLQLKKTLVAKQDSLTIDIDHTKTRISKHAPQLASIQQKLELIAEEISDREANMTNTPFVTTITDADVEVTLLREKQQRSRS